MYITIVGALGCNQGLNKQIQKEDKKNTYLNGNNNNNNDEKTYG